MYLSVLFNDVLNTNTIQHRWRMNECGILVEWYWQGNTDVVGEKRVPVSPCPPQIRHGCCPKIEPGPHTVRGRQLTAWAMAHPQSRAYLRSIFSKRKCIRIMLHFLRRVLGLLTLRNKSIQHLENPTAHPCPTTKSSALQYNIYIKFLQGEKEFPYWECKFLTGWKQLQLNLK
jgi:hypothetical protein